MEKISESKALGIEKFYTQNKCSIHCFENHPYFKCDMITLTVQRYLKRFVAIRICVCVSLFVINVTIAKFFIYISHATSMEE